MRLFVWMDDMTECPQDESALTNVTINAFSKNMEEIIHDIYMFLQVAFFDDFENVTT